MQRCYRGHASRRRTAAVAAARAAAAEEARASAVHAQLAGFVGVLAASAWNDAPVLGSSSEQRAREAESVRPAGPPASQLLPALSVCVGRRRWWAVGGCQDQQLLLRRFASRFRGNRLRRYFLALLAHCRLEQKVRRYCAAAVDIQAHWRGHAARRRLERDGGGRRRRPRHAKELSADLLLLRAATAGDANSAAHLVRREGRKATAGSSLRARFRRDPRVRCRERKIVNHGRQRRAPRTDATAMHWLPPAHPSVHSPLCLGVALQGCVRGDASLLLLLPPCRRGPGGLQAALSAAAGSGGGVDPEARRIAAAEASFRRCVARLGAERLSWAWRRWLGYVGYRRARAASIRDGPATAAYAVQFVFIG
jgi:hypothetical protein